MSKSLPPNWVCLESKSRKGLKYFYNKKTGESTWVPPKPEQGPSTSTESFSNKSGSEEVVIVQVSSSDGVVVISDSESDGSFSAKKRFKRSFQQSFDDKAEMSNTQSEEVTEVPTTSVAVSSYSPKQKSTFRDRFVPQSKPFLNKFGPQAIKVETPSSSLPSQTKKVETPSNSLPSWSSTFVSSVTELKQMCDKYPSQQPPTDLDGSHSNASDTSSTHHNTNFPGKKQRKNKKRTRKKQNNISTTSAVGERQKSFTTSPLPILDASSSVVLPSTASAFPSSSPTETSRPSVPSSSVRSTLSHPDQFVANCMSKTLPQDSCHQSFSQKSENNQTHFNTLDAMEIDNENIDSTPKQGNQEDLSKISTPSFHPLFTTNFMANTQPGSSNNCSPSVVSSDTKAPINSIDTFETGQPVRKLFGKIVPSKSPFAKAHPKPNIHIFAPKSKTSETSTSASKSKTLETPNSASKTKDVETPNSASKSKTLETPTTQSQTKQPLKVTTQEESPDVVKSVPKVLNHQTKSSFGQISSTAGVRPKLQPVTPKAESIISSSKSAQCKGSSSSDNIRSTPSKGSSSSDNICSTPSKGSSSNDNICSTSSKSDVAPASASHSLLKKELPASVTKIKKEMNTNSISLPMNVVGIYYTPIPFSPIYIVDKPDATEVIDLTQSVAEDMDTLDDFHSFHKDKTQLWVVIDTNILIHSLITFKKLFGTNIKNFGSPSFILPWIVVQELDRLKDSKKYNPKNQEVGNLAMEAVRYIHTHLKAKSYRMRGQTPQEDKEESDFPIESNDDRILHCCLQYHKKYPNSCVCLITKDINLRNKATIMGIDNTDIDKFHTLFPEDPVQPSPAPTKKAKNKPNTVFVYASTPQSSAIDSNMAGSQGKTIADSDNIFKNVNGIDKIVESSLKPAKDIENILKHAQKPGSSDDSSTMNNHVVSSKLKRTSVTLGTNDDSNKLLKDLDNTANSLSKKDNSKPTHNKTSKSSISMKSKDNNGNNTKNTASTTGDITRLLTMLKKKHSDRRSPVSTVKDQERSRQNQSVTEVNVSSTSNNSSNSMEDESMVIGSEMKSGGSHVLQKGETQDLDNNGNDLILAKFDCVWKLVFDVKSQIQEIVDRGDSDPNYSKAVLMLDGMIPLLKEVYDVFQGCLALSPILISDHADIFEKLTFMLNRFFIRAGVAGGDPTQPINHDALMVHFKDVKNRIRLLSGLKQMSEFVSQYEQTAGKVQHQTYR